MVSEVLETMATLAADGTTLLCVTHEMNFARQVADRVVLMERGRIVDICEPRVFFNDPRHRRARSFVSQAVN